MWPPSWSQPQRPLGWSAFLSLVPTSFCALSKKEAGDDLASSHSLLSCFTKEITAIWNGTPMAPLSLPLKSICTFYNLPSPWYFLWGRNTWTCPDSPWNYGVRPPPIKPYVIYLLTFSHSTVLSSDILYFCAPHFPVLESQSLCPAIIRRPPCFHYPSTTKIN